MSEAGEPGPDVARLKKPFAKRMKIVIGAIVATLLATACMSAVAVHVHQQNVEQERIAAIAKEKAEKRAYALAALKRAYKDCVSYTQSDAVLPDTLSLEDSGKTLIISAPNSAATTYEAYKCVIGDTNMPESTQNKISTTTAMSGTQRDSWKNLGVTIKATWTYSGLGTSGLNVTMQVG